MPLTRRRLTTRKAATEAETISRWLSRKGEEYHAEGLILELADDLNSAVVAALAKKAVGPRAVGYILIHRENQEHVNDARLLAKSLGIHHELIDLTEHYNLFLKTLPGVPSSGEKEFTARLHAAVLHRLAESRNALLLSTINRTEWEIGAFTKFGNDAAHLFPILHLTSRQVAALAEALHLPSSLIEKSTARIRSILDEVGISPNELDDLLEGNPSRIPLQCREKIETLQYATVNKRLPRIRFSLLEEPSEEEARFAEDHEAYDKSIEALLLISKAVTSDQYLEDILRLIVMVTAEVMDSSVCSLWLLDEKEKVLRLRATQSIDSEYLRDRVLKVGEGVVGKVVAEKRPYFVTDVLTDPFYKEKELARRMGLVSMLSMPMKVKDRVIGVINCYTSHPHAFSDLQMNVLTAVANQAAVAIEKTELIVQTKIIQEELEKRKLIERAKDLLMKRFEISGEDAYRWLQKRSMNTRKSMREVAEAVLLAMEG